MVITEIDRDLVGSEGAAYCYHVRADSDGEMDDLVQEVWGLSVHSDEDDASSLQSDEDDDDRSLPDSPPPDDTKCNTQHSIICIYL